MIEGSIEAAGERTQNPQSATGRGEGLRHSVVSYTAIEISGSLFDANPNLPFLRMKCVTEGVAEQFRNDVQPLFDNLTEKKLREQQN